MPAFPSPLLFDAVATDRQREQTRNGRHAHDRRFVRRVA